MKRQRGRNRKPSGANNANNANPNRSWDSQGPENIKVRGNAQTVYERYQQLGRDATASGDRVLAENYMQHAEHYFRVLRALQPQRPVSEIAARELSNQGFDIDFEDETGAQAAAFLAAQQAADRAAQQGENRNNDRSNDRGNDRANDRDGENGSRDQSRNENRGEGQQREWRDRDNRDRDNRDRDNQNRDQNRSERSGEDRETRAEGEEGQGGRRETRRERWERRREERNRRFEAEGGVGEAPDNAAYSGSDQGDAAPVSEPAVEAVEERAVETPVAVKTERPRRTRMPRENDAEDAPSALPGFLTRSAAPAAPVAETVDAAAADAEAPAPKRRAPRRKVEAATED